MYVYIYIYIYEREPVHCDAQASGAEQVAFGLRRKIPEAPCSSVELPAAPRSSQIPKSRISAPVLVSVSVSVYLIELLSMQYD